MKSVASIAAAAGLAAVSVMAKEMPVNEARHNELYKTGKVMDNIMEYKKNHYAAEKAAGLLNSSQWPRLNYTKCINGVAEAIKGDPLHTFSKLHYHPRVHKQTANNNQGARTWTCTTSSTTPPSALPSPTPTA